MNKILEVFETSGKDRGNQYSRVKIREIYLNKTQNLVYKQMLWIQKKNSQSKKNIQFTQKWTKSASNDRVQQKYKQITNKAYNNYQFRLENELRTTSKTNSKEFWKILNSFLKKK